MQTQKLQEPDTVSAQEDKKIQRTENNRETKVNSLKISI